MQVLEKSICLSAFPQNGCRSVEGKWGDGLLLGHLKRWWFGACLRLPLRFPFVRPLDDLYNLLWGFRVLVERRLLRPRPVAHIPLGLSLPSLDKNYIIAACDLILLKEHFEVSFPLFSFFFFTFSLSHSLCNVQIAHIKSPPFPPPSFPALLPHLFLSCFCIPYSLVPTPSFSKFSFRCCQIVYDVLIALMCVIALTCMSICALVLQTPRWSDTKPHLSTSSTFKDNLPPCWLREMENRQRERKEKKEHRKGREKEKEWKIQYCVCLFFFYSCFFSPDITAMYSKHTHDKEIKRSHCNLVRTINETGLRSAIHNYAPSPEPVLYPCLIWEQ